MAFPTSTPTKVHLDASTDSPASARSELVTMIDLVTQIIQSYAGVSGLCDLDSSGKVPAARLPEGSGTGVDADLLDGQEGAYYQNAGNLNAGTMPADRFTDASHGTRGGGSLHADATASTDGFMPAADKDLVNNLRPIAGSTYPLKIYLEDSETVQRTYNPGGEGYLDAHFYGIGGTITFNVDVTGSGPGYYANALRVDLYKNGVLEVSAQAHSNAATTTVNHDFTVEPGDNLVIEIYSLTAGNSVVASNMSFSSGAECICPIN